MGDYPTERQCTLSPDFEDVLNCDNFVDKSGLIFAILKSKFPVILCTAPRRFGKTVNLDMIQLFLELEVDENGIEKTTVLEEKVNYKLFNSARFKLKVMDQQNKNFVTTHFGQYPIIKMNLQTSVRIRNQSDAVNLFRRATRQAFQQHEYLYESTVSPLKDDEKDVCRQWCSARAYEEIPEKHVQAGLVDLVVYLNKFHKKKVFLLVDEYDSIVSNALYDLVDAKLDDLAKVTSFAIGAIGDALKQVPQFFQGVFMTGILDIAGIKISSVLGNLMRRQFGTPNLCQDYYGFSEDEVDMLFNRFEVEEGLRKKAKAKYNGYYNGDKKRLYNPQSIVQFLENLDLGEGALQNYWQQSGYIEKMYNLFNEDVVRNLLTSLLQSAIDMPDLKLGPLKLSDLQSLHGILAHSNLRCDQHIIVRFFISLGYLTYADSKLQIPNGDIIEEFTKELREYFFIEYGIDANLSKDCSKSFSKLVSLCEKDGSLTEFKKELANFQSTVTRLLQQSEIIDPLNEATLQSIITLTCTHNGFLFGNEIIIPNYRTKIDIMLFNDKSGIIIELKCDPHAVEDAVKQVFENHYFNVFTMAKYFNDRHTDPSLSLIMGMHVDSEKKASVMCLRKEDIRAVLDDHNIAAEPSLENGIEIAVNTKGEEIINPFCERAIRVS